MTKAIRLKERKVSTEGSLSPSSAHISARAFGQCLKPGLMVEPAKDQPCNDARAIRRWGLMRACAGMLGGW